jgi:hypothetical protein
MVENLQILCPVKDVCRCRYRPRVGPGDLPQGASCQFYNLGMLSSGSLSPSLLPGQKPISVHGTKFQNACHKDRASISSG